MKALVAYFSASGVTAKVAGKLAEAIDAPLYEIRPAEAYTGKDLDWRNPRSRSSVEMKDKDCRPELMDKDAPIADAEVIFIGYPIWWYREPSIIDSFLEAYDFSGKIIVPFATSGSSDMGKEAPERIAQLSKTRTLEGKRFKASADRDQLKEWADSLEL